MTHLLAMAQVQDEVLIVIALPIVGGILIALAAILSSNWRNMQRDDMAASLKMEMIERGMSAEEIERVLAAPLNTSRPRSFSLRGRRPWDRPRVSR